MAGMGLWPGWDPLATPLAVYDGARTVVFRHPSPGPDYQPPPDVPGAWTRPGRDPVITANTSAMLGSVSSATVMLDAASARPAGEWGAVALHELFHVYQRRQHPTWEANEGDLFTYPLEDAGALALRREETFSLSQAMTSADDDEAACWVERFSTLRATRYARLGAAAAAYERGTELNEGLAHYVELSAAGRRVALRPEEYPAAQVRQRAYDVGASLGAVLTQLAPGWRDTLNAAPAGTSLDELATRLAARRRTPASPRCSARSEQRARFVVDATSDVEALRRERAASGAAYLTREGWRLEVVAATPLFPEGFDPLNVTRLDSITVLHSRFVKLGRNGASLQVLGRAALTEGIAGQHPLFAGVRRLVVTGLPLAPSLSDSARVVGVRADGVEGSFPRARVDTGDHLVRITLP